MSRTETIADVIPSILTKDGFGNRAVRVVVTAENVPPSNILLSSQSVLSGSLATTRIGIITVVDPNSADHHTLSIVDDPDEKFSIENDQTSDLYNSYLVLKNSVDSNISTSHNVKIRAVDDGGLSVEVAFIITVTATFQNVSSLSFNGIDEYADGGDIHNYDVATAFSICGWLRPNNISNNMIFFSKATVDANVNGYMLRSNPTTGALFLQMRTTTVNRNHIFDTALTAASWQFICFTYSGGSDISGASVYRNAVKNTTSPSGSLSGTMLQGQPFYLGQRNNSFGFYSGKMDEVSIWDKELTQAEITELYNNGVPTDVSNHSASGNLQSWYRIDGDTIPSLTDNFGSDDLIAVNMTSTNITTDVP